MDNYEQIAQQYRMIYDHHTHTVYSHGTGTIEDNVKVAVSKGLKSIAITDHGPGHLTYGIKRNKIDEMRAEIERLKAVYPQIEILLGVEANTVTRGNFIDVRDNEKDKFDILLAGYHYGILGANMVSNFIHAHADFLFGRSNGLRMMNNSMIRNALFKNKIDILTHPCDKGPFDIEDIARACEKTGTLIEINGKHKHLSVEEIKVAAEYDVKFVIGSDAHSPEYVGEFKEQLIRALKAGLDPARIVNIERI